jgi:hemoglobin
MDNETNVTPNQNLYVRLGGEPRLREIVDDVVDRIADNPFLEYYFRTVDKGLVKVLAFEYMSMKAGGPDQYTGREVHRTFYSLNIRPEEYQYALDDAVFILNEKGINQKEKNEILDILEALRNEIIRVKAL